MTNKSKRIIIAAIVILCIIISVCIFLIPHKMTSEKRLDDFEYTCDTIEASLHQLNDYEMPSLYQAAKTMRNFTI